MKKNKGFTLIELLVTIIIIGILSSILFLGSRTEEKKLALMRAAYVLTQDLREIQEMAMGAGEVSCNGDTTHSFGVYFHRVILPDSYLIFADCNDNQHKEDKEVLREVKLGEGLRIQHVAPPPVALNIVFVPPDPMVYINGVESGAEGTISIWLESDPTKSKTIRINSAGRIEME